MDGAITCPYCGEDVTGMNPGDLLNSLGLHFADECTGITEDEALHL